jgi:hypothetical protein
MCTTRSSRCPNALWSSWWAHFTFSIPIWPHSNTRKSLRFHCRKMILFGNVGALSSPNDGPSFPLPWTLSWWFIMSALPTYSNSCVIVDDKHNFTRLWVQMWTSVPKCQCSIFFCFLTVFEILAAVAVSFLCVDFYFANFFGRKKSLGKLWIFLV